MSEENEGKAIQQLLAAEVYSDAVAPAMREFSKIGVDAIKVLRLALFPLQLGSSLQDRLARYLAQSLEAVPEERRIAPRDSIMLPVSDRLRYQEEDNPLSSLYVNLLARAMDRERVGEAHPAFIHLIGQLAPDEVSLMRQLVGQPYRIYVRSGQDSPAISKQEATTNIARTHGGLTTYKSLVDALVQPETLAQPEFFLTFLDHLASLGLVEYTNEVGEEHKSVNRMLLGYEMHFIRLSKFGDLFHRACIGDVDAIK